VAVGVQVAFDAMGFLAKQRRYVPVGSSNCSSVFSGSTVSTSPCSTSSENTLAVLLAACPYSLPPWSATTPSQFRSFWLVVEKTPVSIASAHSLPTCAAA